MLGQIKRISKLVLIVCLLGMILSCSTHLSVKKSNDTELSGYTLKNKKELMQQKILRKESKSIIATP